MNIYKHTLGNATLITTHPKYSWGFEVTDGVLLDYPDVSLSDVYVLYETKEISYIQYKRYLDEWYQYHFNNGNTEIIEANKDYLLRANTLGREAVYEAYGDYAYIVLDEYHERSKECRLKMYSVATSVIRTHLELQDQIIILSTINQYSLERNYIEYGIEGKNYGDAVAGIMDYIEATNEFSTIGIANMPLEVKNGLTKEDIINKLKKYLVYGEIN